MQDFTKGNATKQILLFALLVMEIPSVYNVDEDFYSYVQDNDKITVNADDGLITVERD